MHHSVLYFGETSMCLCHIVPDSIRYVENALKTHDKTNGKTKEHGFIYSNRGIIFDFS